MLEQLKNVDAENKPKHLGTRKLQLIQVLTI